MSSNEEDGVELFSSACERFQLLRLLPVVFLFPEEFLRLSIILAQFNRLWIQGRFTTGWRCGHDVEVRSELVVGVCKLG